MKTQIKREECPEVTTSCGALMLLNRFKPKPPAHATVELNFSSLQGDKYTLQFIFFVFNICQSISDIVRSEIDV
jgi:hypothetical protein